MRCLPFMAKQARIGKTWWSLDLIFAYGHGCYAFKNNICGDRPKILDGMLDSTNPLPPEFLDNPRSPPAPIATDAINLEIDQGGAIGDLEGGVVAKE